MAGLRLFLCGFFVGSRQSVSWLIFAFDSTVASEVFVSTSTVTEPAIPSSSAFAVLVDQLLKNAPLRPSVVSMYFVTAPYPSLRMLSTNSPHESGMYWSKRVRNGYDTSEMTRVARSPSRLAPPSTVAVAVFVTTATATATLTMSFALVPALLPVVSCLRLDAALGVDRQLLRDRRLDLEVLVRLDDRVGADLGHDRLVDEREREGAGDAQLAVARLDVRRGLVLRVLLA